MICISRDDDIRDRVWDGWVKMVLYLMVSMSGLYHVLDCIKSGCSGMRNERPMLLSLCFPSEWVKYSTYIEANLAAGR